MARHRYAKTGVAVVAMTISCVSFSVGGEPLLVTLRDQHELHGVNTVWETRARQERWEPGETAIIVCDVWDLHHCLNAVRRLEQFAPRLNEVLAAARDRGVTIIHAPSDCMEAYAGHPARHRAQQAPRAARLPHDVASWCSLIPAEERSRYPIDQSDGGEDDDPAEHADWAAKLQAMGRNPQMPWKSQSELITIDAERDFVSDRGDEVWNVLEQQGIRNVILTGVHLNMCVLGRPFGLRQMARNGKHVVLMRDMTDTMYNPQRWPYVSHQRGTELMVAHVERYVCPTITSDQIAGGEPFQLQPVGRSEPPAAAAAPSAAGYDHRWVPMTVPGSWAERSAGLLADYAGPGWYRCVVRIPAEWLAADPKLTIQGAADPSAYQAWLNGRPLEHLDRAEFAVPRDALVADDANLLVVRAAGPEHAFSKAPHLVAGSRRLELAGGWQFRTGDDASFVNMPLPARFGGSTDIVHEPDGPLFVARALTRAGLFTAGIEGPACDQAGNIFAVNFGRQGTIGRVSPQGAGEIFVELPEGSVGNGIRFDADGFFYVADYTRHQVLKVDPMSRDVIVFAQNSEMHQPNDLAIDAAGTLYASDPDWQKGTGQIWRIDRDGTTTRLRADMGTTNGIEVSPDGTTLYVNESVQRRIWAFTIDAGKTLSNQRLFHEFADHGMDGMRCDVDGNLYVTRYGMGTVVKLSPAGDVLREIPLPGRRPSNICFGGPDGRTAYVTEVDFARLVTFRVDRPGLAWSRHARERP